MNPYEDIMHLINQYSYTIDSGDLEGFASLFDNAEWIIEGMFTFSGKQQVLDYLVDNVRIYEDGTTRTRHLTTNVDIRFNNDKTKASGQCYVSVIQQTDDLPLQIIFSGVYFDEFMCTEGQWRFVSRTVTSPLMGDMSGHLK